MARDHDIEEVEPNQRGEALRIGIVMSRFNAEVGEGLLSSCTATLTEVDELEVPVHLALMARPLGRTHAKTAIDIANLRLQNCFK